MTTKVDDIMKEKFLCQARFAEEVEKIVKENNFNYIDAIITFCEENKIEVDAVSKLISKPLKEKFKYDGHQYDTMVAEYLRAKARKWSLSLESLAKRYNVKQKEVDLIAPYLKDKKTFYDIPADIVEEYGKADVIATEQVAVKQLEAFGLTFEELYETDIKTIL